MKTGVVFSVGAFGSGTATPQVGSDLPTALTMFARNRWAPNLYVCYDEAGNVLAVRAAGMCPGGSGLDVGEIATPPTGAERKFTYDAENRMTGVVLPGAATIYSYDAEGRRVRTETLGGVTTTFVYDAFGKLAAEESTQAAQYQGTEYVTTDHLGSTRMVTDGNGAVARRYDYLPFGETIRESVSGRTTSMGYWDGLSAHTWRQQFTGKERDGETGLDYFGARYFSAAQGRFTSPDPTFMTRARITDPQQWNLCAYVRNNPLMYVDPDGKELKLAIYNSSGVARYVASRVADRIALNIVVQALRTSPIPCTRGGRVLPPP